MFDALRKLVRPSVPQPEHTSVSSVQKPKQAVSKSAQNNLAVPKDEFIHDERAQTCSDYRTLVTGVQFQGRDKENFVNGVNVEKLITLFELRPTKAAEQYLRGMKDKLNLLLREQSANVKNHERLVSVSQKLDHALQNSRHSRLRLLAGGDSNSAV